MYVSSSDLQYPNGIRFVILCLAAVSLIPRLTFCERSFEKYSAKPSKTDSIKTPSGESVMFSIADITRTPLSFNFFLYMALSYRFLENLSNFQTRTTSKTHCLLSAIIFKNCGRLSVVAVVARSIYELTICKLLRAANCSQSCICPSIDCSVWLLQEYLA